MSKCAFFVRTCLFTLLCVAAIGWLAAAPAQAAVPDGYKVQPAPNSVVTELKPVIKVRYPKDADIAFGSARLWVNGVEVSGSSLRTPRYISFQPFVAMPSGKVDVRLEAKTASNVKGTIKASWTFELQTPQMIKSITTNCDHDMSYMEDIVVQAETTPGAAVWFSLEDIVDEVTMNESVPGHYEGRYKVKLNDNKMQAKVTVYAKIGGHQYSRVMDKTVCISGRLFTVTILTPQHNELVPLTFRIKGHTRPKSIVYIQPNIGMSEGMNTSANNRNRASASSIPCYADEEGNFELNYGFPIMLPNMQAKLVFQAVDPEGNRSLPNQLWVKFKPN